MKKSFNICVGVSVLALVDIQSASASPSFSPICFETEAAAQKHHDYYYGKGKTNDRNVESGEKVRLANALIQNGEVRLSDLENILGESEVQTYKNPQIPVHKWVVGFSSGTMVGSIQYNTRSGYCVPTRHPHFWSVEYTWRGSGYDSPYGLALMQSFDW